MSVDNFEYLIHSTLQKHHSRQKDYAHSRNVSIYHKVFSKIGFATDTGPRQPQRERH